MKLRHSLIFVLIFVFVAGVAFSQEAKMPPTYVGGQVFFEWANNMTDEGDTDPADKRNTFRMTRLWLVFYKAFSPVWSFYSILGFDNAGGDDRGIMVYDEVGVPQTAVTYRTTQRYRAYVFMAQVMAKKAFGPVEATLKYGVLVDPIICSTGSNSWCDIRWLRDNLLYGTNPYGYGINFYHATDLGAGVDLKILKGLIMADLQITNGEGWLYVDEQDNEVQQNYGDKEQHGKAYQGRVTLTLPFLTALHISAYYRLEELSGSADDNEGFMAGSLWYRDKLINAGVYYILPYKNVGGDPIETVPGTEDDVTIIDSYINIYLDSLIGMPITLIASYGVGEDDANDDTQKTYTGLGVAYTFAKLVRIGLWYQIQTNDADPNGEDNKQFFVKTEVQW
jgi:hypothetical protein